MGMIDVATCFSPSWSRFAAIGMFSFFKNNPGEVKFHLLTDALAPEDETRFDRVCEYFGPRATYTHYNLQSFYHKRIHSRYVSTGRFTNTVLYKLAMPFFLTPNRVLFLDTDALCVANIHDFYHQDLGDNLIAGCIDIGVSPKIKAAIGMMDQLPYINAGVILCDMRAIREEKLGELWLSIVQSRRLPLNDQDCINMTISPRIKVLPPDWNCSLSTGFVENAQIYHLAGPKSPWVAGLRNAEIWYKAEAEFEQAIEAPHKPPKKIAKRIAYCWFGRGPKPPLIETCIRSWSICMPDYELTEINEDNFDVHANAFSSAAYNARKFAYVSDVARFHWLRENSGVTVDADCQAVARLDPYLHHAFFSGSEVPGQILVTATIGAEANHPLVAAVNDYYKTAVFDPSKMVPNTQFLTAIIKAFVLKNNPDGSVDLGHDGWLAPKEVFCNYLHKRRRVLSSPKAVVIHHFCGSWVSK